MGKIKQNNIEPVTKVIFRKFKDGSIIALFIIYGMKQNKCLCYIANDDIPDFIN